MAPSASFVIRDAVHTKRRTILFPVCSLIWVALSVIIAFLLTSDVDKAGVLGPFNGHQLHAYKSGTTSNRVGRDSAFTPNRHTFLYHLPCRCISSDKLDSNIVPEIRPEWEQTFPWWAFSAPPSVPEVEGAFDSSDGVFVLVLSLLCNKII